jgi:hypothetical protein
MIVVVKHNAVAIAVVVVVVVPGSASGATYNLQVLLYAATGTVAGSGCYCTVRTGTVHAVQVAVIVSY